MDELDIRWLAGLYEGEGWVICRPYSTKRGGDSRQVRIGIGSVDRDVIETVARLTGVGSITTRPPRERAQEFYIWQVSRRDDVLRLLEVMRPHLHARRRGQVEPVMEYIRGALKRRRANGVRACLCGETDEAQMLAGRAQCRACHAALARARRAAARH